MASDPGEEDFKLVEDFRSSPDFDEKITSGLSLLKVNEDNNANRLV